MNRRSPANERRFTNKAMFEHGCEPDGWVRVRLDYDVTSYLPAMRRSVPRPARRWNPTARAWCIEPAYVADLHRALDAVEACKQRQREKTGTPIESRQALTLGMLTVFEQLPEHMRRPALDALAAITASDPAIGEALATAYMAATNQPVTTGPVAA